MFAERIWPMLQREGSFNDYPESEGLFGHFQNPPVCQCKDGISLQLFSL